MSTPEQYYDWTFHYELSRPVYCKESTDDNTIKFIKEGDNLKGFDIIVNNETDSKARETSEKKKKNLEGILIVLSGDSIRISTRNVCRIAQTFFCVFALISSNLYLQ